MNGHSSSNGSNGKANGKAAAESLTAGNMYQLCLEARPYFGGEWFSLTDTATRLSLHSAQCASIRLSAQSASRASELASPPA